MSRDLRALPKAHLHLHMEGAMCPATLVELTERYALHPCPSQDGSFATFIRTYRQAADGLRSADDLHRLVDEVVADAAADGAVWVEPAEWITPWMAERTGLANEEAVLQVVLEALADASRAHHIGAGLLVSTNRMREPAEAEALARLAARYAGRGVVSFGLADNDALGPPEPVRRRLCHRARGRLDRCAPRRRARRPRTRRGALDALGAQRIQHGVRAVEDPPLLERLARSRCAWTCA